ncbi:MAG: methyltransferase domain-containing protein [Saprospiraceae bacterium]
MSTPEATKATIRFEYGKIVALTATHGLNWQRGHICKPIFDPIAAAYPEKAGYLDAANLGLGCGFPVEQARVQAGETVLDLGCAAGIDSFIARAAVGAGGQVIGLDITPELVALATQIAQNQDFANVRFLCADIENLPVDDESVDVIISNGVFSLLSSRLRVFQEMHRVLQPGGRFCVCDLVRKEDLPDTLQAEVLAFTGCLNGIFHVQEYLNDLQQAGFRQVAIRSERSVPVPIAGNDAYQGLYAVALVGSKAA